MEQTTETKTGEAAAGQFLTGMTQANVPEHIMQFFAYGHLPQHLQTISKPFGDIALWVEHTLPKNPERTVALRKLLEAKDAAVRALIAK